MKSNLLLIFGCCLIFGLAYLTRPEQPMQINQSPSVASAAPEMTEPHSEVIDGVAIYDFRYKTYNTGLLDIPDVWLRIAAQEVLPDGRPTDQLSQITNSAEKSETIISKTNLVQMPVPSPTRVARVARVQDQKTKNIWRSSVRKWRKGRKSRRKIRRTRRKSKARKSQRTKTKLRRKTKNRRRSRYTKRRKVRRRQRVATNTGYSTALRRALKEYR